MNCWTRLTRLTRMEGSSVWLARVGPPALPQGAPRRSTRGGYAKVIQTPTLIVILYEDLSYRQIHMDGRTLPKEPHPTFMGYSVGRWDGDTLVVETIGFNDRMWLDFGGHPLTERLRMVERFRRESFGAAWTVGRR